MSMSVVATVDAAIGAGVVVVVVVVIVVSKKIEKSVFAAIKIRSSIPAREELSSRATSSALLTERTSSSSSSSIIDADDDDPAAPSSTLSLREAATASRTSSRPTRGKEHSSSYEAPSASLSSTKSALSAFPWAAPPTASSPGNRRIPGGA